jgi:zinc transporter 1/2/3
LPENSTLKKAIVFVIALSVHSFLEGLGISGKSIKELAWYALGLVGHKWVEAFALGVSILTSPFSGRSVFLLILLYSSLTPLGSIVGMILLMCYKESSKFNVVKEILVGMSSGSFFYIGFIEMLNSEFQSAKAKVNGRQNRNKLMAIVAGFFFMTTIVIGCLKLESMSL